MSSFAASSQRNGAASGNRWQVLLFLLLGLICGVCLSRLLHRARLQFHDDVSSQPATSAASSSSSVSHSNSSERVHWSNNATRILCLVVASPLHSHATHIERTWGRRCNKLLFMGSQRDKNGMNMKVRHTNSWAKTRHQLQHVYQYYYDDYDWFLKVPIDT